MELNKKNVTADKLITTGDYVEYLKEKFLNNKISHETILYNLKNTDNIDFVVVGKFYLIVFNEKAMSYKPGSKRTRKK